MRLIAALVIGLALAAAGRADAQLAPWQPDRLTPGWTFTPSMMIGGMWDSNVTVRNEGSIPVEEWVGLLNPRGELDYNGRHTRFTAGYSGTLQTYRELSALSRYDQRARVDAQRQLSRRLSLETRHTVAATPTTDDLEINGLPYARVGSKSYSGRGGVQYVLSDRTALATDYSFQWVRFDRDEVEFTELRGGQSQGIGTSVNHRLSQRVSAGGSWQFVRAHLAADDFAADDLAANIHRALAEASWQLGPSTTVSGGAGLSHVSVPGTDISLTGPAAAAGIEHHAGRVRINARYEQSYAATYTFGNALAHRSVSGSVFVPLLQGRMFISGSGAVRRSSPAELDSDVISLDSILAHTTVGYRVARWLRVEGFYTGTFQDSSARGEYNRSRIGLQLVTSKPVRIQ